MIMKMKIRKIDLHIFLDVNTYLTTKLCSNCMELYVYVCVHTQTIRVYIN